MPSNCTRARAHASSGHQFARSYNQHNIPSAPAVRPRIGLLDGRSTNLELRHVVHRLLGTDPAPQSRGKVSIRPWNLQESSFTRKEYAIIYGHITVCFDTNGWNEMESIETAMIVSSLFLLFFTIFYLIRFTDLMKRREVCIVYLALSKSICWNMIASYSFHTRSKMLIDVIVCNVGCNSLDYLCFVPETI